MQDNTIIWVKWIAFGTNQSILLKSKFLKNIEWGNMMFENSRPYKRRVDIEDDIVDVERIYFSIQLLLFYFLQSIVTHSKNLLVLLWLLYTYMFIYIKI